MKKYREAFSTFSSASVVPPITIGGARKGPFYGMYAYLKDFGAGVTIPDWLEQPFAEQLDVMEDAKAGEKYIAPLWDIIYQQAEIVAPGSEQETALKLLGAALWQKFNSKWERDAEIWGYDYNLGENYNMTETETPNLTDTRTPNLTDTETPNISTKHKASADFEAAQERTVKSKNTESQYGFNSTSPVPVSENSGAAADNVDKSTTTQAGYTEDEETGTRTMQRTGSETHTHTGSRTLNRSGNIGVTTTTQMLEESAKFWKNYNFLSSIMEDVTTEITLPIWPSVK